MDESRRRRELTVSAGDIQAHPAVPGEVSPPTVFEGGICLDLDDHRGSHPGDHDRLAAEPPLLAGREPRIVLGAHEHCRELGRLAWAERIGRTGHAQRAGVVAQAEDQAHGLVDAADDAPTVASRVLCIRRFTHPRWPGRYRCPAPWATRPSTPTSAAVYSSSQRRASARSPVCGVSFRRHWAGSSGAEIFDAAPPDYRRLA